MSGRAIQRAILQQAERISQIALEKLLARKLKEAGVRRFRKVAGELSKHLLENGDSEFTWGEGSSDKAFNISFTGEDASELARIAKDTTDRVADITPRLCSSLAKQQSREISRGWREVRYKEERWQTGFRHRLEDRWGDALDGARILVEVCSQRGEEITERFRRSRARKTRHRSKALIELHVRACQMYREIIILLENGYPQGALARWRSLYELSVMAILIAEHSNDLAERYLDYEVIETCGAMARYLVDHQRLGYRAPANRDVAAAQRAKARMVEKHGKAFANTNGWAATIITKDKIHFMDLEEAAERSHHRSFYKMASFSVHATPKGLRYQVDPLNLREGPIAGATNFGLDEPAIRASETLCLITSCLPLIAESAIDRAVADQVVLNLRDFASAEFVKSDKRLCDEERELHRELRRFGTSANLDDGFSMDFGLSESS